jgi:transposase
VLSVSLKADKINPLNAKLNPICHLLALLAHPILYVSRIRVKYRAAIKFSVKEGLTPNETHSKVMKVYGDSSSFSTIKKWAVEFKRGRTSLEDGPCEGRPKIAPPPEITEQVHDMVLDDRRMELREVAETTGISKERREYILHAELYMKKLCARWVPRLLVKSCVRKTKFWGMELNLSVVNPGRFNTLVKSAINLWVSFRKADYF